ncbi:MAG TPA: hypothetical protein VMD97_14315 [Candidatus Aquilonibacter sp.]|nr:hypothetical protein [Candidatus Aquilonibacter sp.]
MLGIVVAFLAFAYEAGAQVVGAPSDSVDQLFNTIRAQESNFPLPTTDETIIVGTIKPSSGPGSRVTYATLFYDVPVYSGPIACTVVNRHNGAHCSGTSGALITVANIRNLSLGFAIDWSGSGAAGPAPSSTTLTIQLGTQTKTVTFGETQVVFDVGADTSPALQVACNVPGQTNPPCIVSPEPIQPIKIDRRIIGAGAITIPAIPVSIVYAPVVDAQKKNQATAAISRAIGTTTSISFSTSNSTTTPVPASFQTVSDMSQAMTVLGGALTKIPNPYTIAIGTALSQIASGLGSSTASQTTTNTVTATNSLAINETTTEAQTAVSSEGGPGSGDLITFYYNAKMVWYSDGGSMRLALLGSDAIEQVTAGTLVKELRALQSKAAGTLDPQTHLDAVSLKELLALDPFVAGGPSADLRSNSRFALVTNEPLVINGGGTTYTAQHQVIQSDISTTAQTTMHVNADKAGFLSFLGLGVTETSTLESQLSQSASTQITSGTTISQSYVLNGNGTEFYACEIYYDKVFGSFAFRDVTKLVTR